jgi:ABC-type molybdate transport system substrate-binding protein
VRRTKLLVVAVIAAAAVAACSDDDEAPSDPGPESGDAGSIHTVAELEEVTTLVRDAYEDEADTRLDIAVSPRNQVVQAVSEGTPSLAILPGPWLEGVDVDSAQLGRVLAVITVPEGNPGGVTGVDAFSPEAGLETAICGPDSPFGNFAALVVRLGGVQPAADRVGSGCEAEAVGQVAGGELDAAFLFRNAVEMPDGVEVINIPEEQNLVIDISYVPVGDDETTRDFVTFLESDRAVEILTRAGYLP